MRARRVRFSLALGEELGCLGLLHPPHFARGELDAVVAAVVELHECGALALGRAAARIALYLARLDVHPPDVANLVVVALNVRRHGLPRIVASHWRRASPCLHTVRGSGALTARQRRDSRSAARRP
eukprot:6209877-Pleurochrysis_carterae.AAC.2